MERKFKYNRMKQTVLLLRPYQWVKNAFCFLPLFFDRHILDMEYLFPCLIAFVGYCFAASGIYCFNDIYDVESDRRHPMKCNRPFASGVISKRIGYMLMAICWIISFAIISSWSFTKGDRNLLYGTISFYILMNIAYCIWLKRFAIIDVFIIALGFDLRILIGGFSTGIWLSEWIIMMTFLLALFLALAKRRDDVVLFEKTGIKVRDSIDRYNVTFMNVVLTVAASITMVCYILYTVSPTVVTRFGSRHIYFTSFFVLLGIFRYMLIAIVDQDSGSPTHVLLKDKFLQTSIVGWIVCFGMLIYI